MINRLLGLVVVLILTSHALARDVPFLEVDRLLLDAGGWGGSFPMPTTNPTAGTMRPSSEDDVVTARQTLAEHAADDPSVQHKAIEAMKAELDTHIANLKSNASTLSWANTGDGIIFLVTHLLVLSAATAAGFEFVQAYRIRNRRRRDGVVPELSNELELGWEKVALKSTLHGLFLLLIAFAFYMAFLKFVHPITTISSGA